MDGVLFYNLPPQTEFTDKVFIDNSTIFKSKDPPAFPYTKDSVPNCPLGPVPGALSIAG